MLHKEIEKVNTMKREIEADNVALYTKIRYLQGTAISAANTDLPVHWESRRLVRGIIMD